MVSLSRNSKLKVLNKRSFMTSVLLTFTLLILNTEAHLREAEPIVSPYQV